MISPAWENLQSCVKWWVEHLQSGALTSFSSCHYNYNPKFEREIVLQYFCKIRVVALEYHVTTYKIYWEALYLCRRNLCAMHAGFVIPLPGLGVSVFECLYSVPYRPRSCQFWAWIQLEILVHTSWRPNGIWSSASVFCLYGLRSCPRQADPCQRLPIRCHLLLAQLQLQ